jgi:hypothetical protein
LQRFAVDACLSGPRLACILKAAIDVAAEDERLKDITDGAGQAMTDQRTADEGKQYIAVAGMAERLKLPISLCC